MIKSYYLDTNAFAWLVNAGGHATECSRCLKRCVRARVCRVVSSPELLEEIVSIPRRDTRERVLSLFWQVVGKGVLRPFNELIWKEIRKGSRLRWGESLIPTALIAKIRMASRDRVFCQEVGREVLEQKERLKEDWAGLVCAADKTLTEELGKKEALRQLNEWVLNNNRIQDWFEHWMSSYVRQHVPQEEKRHVNKLPYARAYVALQLAHMLKRHRNCAKVLGSDRHDLIHFSHASFVGAFVTMDKALTDAIGLIECNCATTITGEQLLRELENL